MWPTNFVLQGIHSTKLPFKLVTGAILERNTIFGKKEPTWLKNKEKKYIIILTPDLEYFDFFWNHGKSWCSSPNNIICNTRSS